MSKFTPHSCINLSTITLEATPPAGATLYISHDSEGGQIGAVKTLRFSECLTGRKKGYEV
jgi:hypothetical protein